MRPVERISRMLALLLLAIVLLTFGSTVTANAGTPARTVGDITSAITPIFETYVISRPTATENLRDTIEAVAGPETVVYVLDVSPDVVCDVLGDTLDSAVTGYYPTEDMTRVVSFVLTYKNGIRKVGSYSFEAPDPDDKTVVERLTWMLNRDFSWDKDSPPDRRSPIIEAISSHEFGLDALLLDTAPHFTSSSYYSAVRTTGPQYQEHFRPGTEPCAGVTNIYLSMKWGWNDGNPNYDFIFVHVKEEITPGHILVWTPPNLWMFYGENVEWWPGSYQMESQAFLKYSPATSDPTSPPPDENVSVSQLGWSPYPGYVNWTYTFAGENDYAPHKIENQCYSSTKAKWFHHADIWNLYYNQDHKVVIQTGWNQRLGQNDHAVIKLITGEGTQGSNVWFYMPGEDDAWGDSVDGYDFDMPKPGY